MEGAPSNPPPEDVHFKCWFCNEGPVLAEGFLEKPIWLRDGLAPLQEYLRPACRDHLEGRPARNELQRRRQSLRSWHRVSLEEGKARLWAHFQQKMTDAAREVLES